MQWWRSIAKPTTNISEGLKGGYPLKHTHPYCGLRASEIYSIVLPTPGGHVT